MAKSYDYVLAVWLRLELTGDARALQDEMREYLEADYQINGLSIVEDPDCGAEDELTISLQLQITFAQSQMDSNGPTEEALRELDRELRAYLEGKYQMNFMEILDDAPTSYLVAEREDDQPPNPTGSRQPR